MNVIEIDELNYQDYTNLDIVAYSFARGGAMGDPGGIKIVDSDGQVYHANYCYGRHTIKSEHIKAVIPVFKDLRISLANCKTENDDWLTVDLGYGNCLFVSKSIRDAFNREVEAGDYDTVGSLYQRWQRIVLKILSQR
jgi:hypothetical protein